MSNDKVDFRIEVGKIEALFDEVRDEINDAFSKLHAHVVMEFSNLKQDAVKHTLLRDMSPASRQGTIFRRILKRSSGEFPTPESTVTSKRISGEFLTPSKRNSGEFTPSKRVSGEFLTPSKWNSGEFKPLRRVSGEFLTASKRDSGEFSTPAPTVSSSTTATEIRCQEKAKGGIKYDVILADPAGTPPVPKRQTSPTRTKSVENIEEKLKAAEERRMSLEASKIANIAAKLSKIEEASKKKDEQNNVFISQTKEALDQKMETHIEKKNAYISDIKSKLKDHLESVEKTRQALEKQTIEVRKEVEEKLSHASAQRDVMLKNVVDRLKDHEENRKKVRALNQEKVIQLEEQIKSKLIQAEERRSSNIKEQLEKLKEQNKVKLDEVKQSFEHKCKKWIENIQEKLDSAEQNRIKELERKVEIARNYERRAEMVRQNKKVSTNQEEQNTAESG